MNPARWESAKRLFHEALERPPGERNDFVSNRAAADAGLRDEVMALIAAHTRGDAAFAGIEATPGVNRLGPGARLGPYEIVALVGVGGMGEVYRAHDTRLGRTVAIKVLPSDVAESADRRKRFEREARAVSSLNHPHICTLHDIGYQDASTGSGQAALFLVMEYLEGDTLTERLTKGPLSIDDALRYAREIAAALDEAHRHGIVHRDLKPGNVVLTRNGAKLLDFGIAKLYEDRSPVPDAATSAPITREGAIVGTPQYMAPEQLEGQAVDARTDVFAFGALLYEMIAGRPPFTGTSTASVMAAILEREPATLHTLEPSTPPWLEALVARCLAKRPADRWQSSAELLAEFGARSSDRTAVARSAAVPAAAIQARRPATRLIVLPFRLLRPDPDIDFFGFSLADAITTSLHGFDALLVRSSAVAARVTGETADIQAIARDADVDLILLGTLVRLGDRIRINAQLVEAPAGTVLWTHATDGGMGDLFQLQDDLTRRLVESLTVPLTAREQRSIGRDVPANGKAYEHYLQANRLALDMSQWRPARDLYEQCLREDPNYAPAWARLGRICWLSSKYVTHESRENLSRAQAAFEIALTINPDLAIAHHLFTSLEVDDGRASEAVVRLVARAREHPHDPELFAGLVHACRYCGLLGASLAADRRARQLDPKIQTSVVATYMALGEYERVALQNVREVGFSVGVALIAVGRSSEASARLLEIEQGESRLRDSVRCVRALADGRRDDCVRGVNEIVAAGMRAPEELYHLARLLAQVDEPAQAIDLLQRAVDGGFYSSPSMARDRWLDPLRHEPGFAAMFADAEARHSAALGAFREAGGPDLLGVDSGE